MVLRRPQGIFGTFGGRFLQRIYMLFAAAETRGRDA